MHICRHCKKPVEGAERFSGAQVSHMACAEKACEHIRKEVWKKMPPYKKRMVLRNEKSE